MASVVAPTSAPGSRGAPSGTHHQLNGFVIALASLLAAGLTLLLEMSLWNTGRSTSYDLGIFSQGAASWATAAWPYSDIRGLPLLGDHFSPLMAVTGLAWRVWPDPRSLLVLQAIATGVTVAVLLRCFRTHLVAGTLAAATFVLGRGLTSAVLFDVHETTMLTPVVALACAALVARRWRMFVLANVLMLLIKEDMGVTVIGFAAAWTVSAGWRERSARRQGLTIALIGLLGIVVAVTVIALVNPSGGSEYLGFFGLGSPPPGQLHSGGVAWQRLLPLLGLGLACLGVGLRSPLVLAALPSIAWRTASSNPLHWSWDYHYDVLTAVIAAFALADVCRRIPARRRAVRLVLGLLLVTQVALSVTQFHERVPEGLTLHEQSRVQHVRELAAKVPTHAPVVTLNDVGPYVLSAHHEHVYDMRSSGPRVRYVMFTLDDEWLGDLSTCQRGALMRPADGRRIERRGDVVLLDLGRAVTWRRPPCILTTRGSAPTPPSAPGW